MSKSDVLFKVGYYAKQLKDDVKIYFFVPGGDGKELQLIATLYAKDAIKVPYYVVDHWFDIFGFNVILSDFVRN